MAEPLHVRPGVEIPPAELAWRFSRSGGPGGQSVNTSDTRVELSYDVARAPSLPPVLRRRALERLAGRLVDGVLTVTASEHRSQLRNRLAAQDRLVDALRRATDPPPSPRRPTRPSRAAVQRRLADKRRRSQAKRERRGEPDGEQAPVRPTGAPPRTPPRTTATRSTGRVRVSGRWSRGGSGERLIGCHPGWGRGPGRRRQRKCWS
ncbi:MAG TPA: alternative ribosome rescue aminoacyl-tRNA hydrolase ArfB, partial [Frankiaceae bacterium]|nr:alternative ribosome rescue aminoacyl-tRNA hydrolase ArfB [Frankiaceae bacterium]